MGLRNKRPRQLNYIVSVRGAKSGDKVKNTVKHYKKLLERTKFEGETKWIKNAMEMVMLKFKKYGINSNKI